MQAKSLYNVREPDLVTYLNRTRMFKWCVVGCGSNSGYHKTCVQKRMVYLLKLCLSF